MHTTNRCKCCGKIMTQTTLADGEIVLQCPRCKYVEPAPKEAKEGE